MKRVIKVIDGLFLLLMISLCIVVLMAGNGKVPYLFGYRILQVVSDSMSPTISGNTCIVIKRVDRQDIQVGDIITFTSEDPRIEGFLNTHRVVNIIEDAESEEVLYITKGDASDEEDAYPVSYDQVAGKYVKELPFGQYIFRAIHFIHDPVNYFIVVMVPLFLCLMSYVKQLFGALFSKEKNADE